MSRTGSAEHSDLRELRRHSGAPLLLLLTLAALCGASTHGDGLLLDAHARVFVAELPPKYNLHTVTAEGCEDGAFLKEILANPLGVPVEGDLELALYRDTPYYSLELHMHLQMLISPLRVLTANEADIVYVPFYATQIQYGLGGEGACKPNWTRPAMDALIAQFWADAPALLPLLGAKPHWMQLSEIEWMIHHGCGEDGWGLPLACHPLAAHMVFATPESMTEPHPVAGHQRFASGRPAANNTVTIPYLGHVHRASMQQRAKLLADERVGAKKAYVASMCFRSMRGTQLRADLARQCDARADECLNVGNDASLPNIIGSYRRAWFCVQPYGDSPTRSAIMDCIASGLAVPAVFDEFLFDMLPFADVINYRAIVAYIPAEAAMAPGASFLDWLRHYDGAARAAMLGSLQAVSQALQYAVQPNHLLVRHDRLADVDPLDDAFTMSLKAVLRHACRLNHRQCRQPRAGLGARHRARAGEGAAGGRRLARSR